MAKHTGCIYGATGTFKTWNLGLLAKEIFKRTKKPVRLVSCDGGKWEPVQKFVDAGMIHPLSLINDQERLYILRAIMNGFWPNKVDEQGNRVGKQMIKNPTEFGGYLFEGITSIGERVLELYSGKKVGMNPAYSETLKSDFKDEKGNSMPDALIGAYSQDSYGVVQREMNQLVLRSWELPVDWVWWSGHEAQAEDEMNRETIRGIAVVGKKATARIPKNIGYLIHAFRVSTGQGDKRKEEVRYYFRSHEDPNVRNVFWDAKVRLSGDSIPALMKKYKEGYFVPGYNEQDKYVEGLDDFIRFISKLEEEGSEDVKKFMEDVLGEEKGEEVAAK